MYMHGEHIEAWEQSVWVFEGSMDIQKYVSILQNKINKIKEMFSKMDIAMR